MVSRCGIDDERGDLLTELTTGFEALLDKVEVLAARNAEFEKQIRSYQEEGRGQFTPTHTKGSYTSSEAEADDGTNEAEILLENDPRIAKGIQAYELLRASMTGTVPLRKKRWRKISPSRTLIGPKPELERDFTTQGTQGELKCPFSKKIHEIEEDPRAAVSKPAQQPQPVVQHTSSTQDEKRPVNHGCVLSASRSGKATSKSITVSNNDSAPQCPIRFLNQIPAEEVAKYFEEHKHEIPRSHEVCVKRYQANKESLRSLDAKYGSLVNMIQGLGEKHQPMLPSQNDISQEDEEDEEVIIEMDKKSMEKVEKWAEGCGDGLGPDKDDERDDRTGHFERPLKEVRLGESPSRPWGIQVPYTEELALSSNAPENDSVAAPVQPETQKDSKPPQRSPGKCPFGHGTAGGAIPQPKTPAIPPQNFDLKPELDPQKRAQPREKPQPQRDLPFDTIGQNDHPRQMIFTGPVFFGYSAEDAALLMRSLKQQ